jgi:Mg-chelatase subunit ChlD
MFTLRTANQMNRSAPPPIVLLEDMVDPPSSEEDAAICTSTVVSLPLVTTNSSPEFPATNIYATSAFHVRVGLKYEENVSVEQSKKVPLDIVCILDNSGSMQGSKLDSLKEAMKFIIGTLGAKDRLSVVYFNSQAGAVHGLLKMTPENKGLSRSRLDAINAEGGTDIFDGMRFGWSVLQQRQSRNPASCVFLLTDGQDRNQLENKKELARTIKSNGTSLFVFGFGADHDSEHMAAIAQAAECPFTYVESDDMVVDAFGGSIGTQQGAALRNISLTISAVAQGVTVAQTMAGSYASVPSADSRSVTVSFANMYEGESRDVMLRLELPTVTAPVPEYSLVTVAATYSVQSIGTADNTMHTSSRNTCVVRRVVEGSLDPLMVRDLNVDVQLNRLKSTHAINSALAAADAGNFDSAKEILTAALAQVTQSVSHRAAHAVTLGLAGDLTDALSRVRSRGEYHAGGRAMMNETSVMNSNQRSCYTKAGRSNAYQSASSSNYQQQASISKTSSKF